MDATPEAPDGLLAAFWSYEHALQTDDVAVLDRLFAPGPDTLRGDAHGLLVGHDAIAGFRATRGGAPARTVVDLHVRPIGPDAALVVAVTELVAGGRGQQTQLWRRDPGGPEGWVVAAAHVTVPAPALDRRVWRLVGDPLVPGRRGGPLTGHRVAVKDLYAVAGQRIGAGNPAWLEQAPVERGHAPVVAALLDAGADVTGISRTDEFAYSLAGTNAHYGTPPNPKAPGRISGGSSSGSASAVALGQATIGLGTDTGGSIRVPAAYQGLYGIRTSHGVIGTDGLLALAPTFDTVGWLTRDAATLAAVGAVLLPADDPGRRGPPTDLVTVPELTALADPDVGAAVTAYALGLDATTESWDLTGLGDWLAAFQTLQAVEAWREHGAWLTDRWDTLGADVRGRFERAASIDDAAADQAARTVARARAAIRDRVADRVLVLPSASSVAPTPGGLAGVRDATMRLTCLAGLGGLPAVSVPSVTPDGLPCGVGLVAAPGRDLALLALAASLGA